MKKIVCIALSALLLLASLSLSACSDSVDNTKELEDIIAQLEDENKNLESIIENLEEQNNKLSKLLEDKKYTYVNLTPDNYNKYISINLFYDDCFYRQNENGFYYLYYTGHITTSKKTDCYFDDVKIWYKIDIEEWETNIASTYVELDYFGTSHGSYFATKKNPSSTIYFPDSAFFDISIRNISGKVIIPQ